MRAASKTAIGWIRHRMAGELVSDMHRSRRAAMWRHIVRCAAEREFHDAWMLEELTRNEYEVTSRVLYPMLRRMEADGVLVAEPRMVNGRSRRFYRAAEATGSRCATRAGETLAEPDGGSRAGDERVARQ
ncbi:helix-turn-helix transcriptional regulator [Streptomyces sp. SID3343]|uniref:helix-turn-helix transcriptional regulator n=1 Tax=Streptomyces sp. SID3343 TaxID=2690260 RepID=UPI0013712026|nr:helix-turn-helix transcriptional regulator [Streptomyces sp. SID3343]MYW00028.1 PadR family transcriptional regulator [Streptomyces sp. SID3343]